MRKQENVYMKNERQIARATRNIFSVNSSSYAREETPISSSARVATPSG